MPYVPISVDVYISAYAGIMGAPNISIGWGQYYGGSAVGDEGPADTPRDPSVKR